MRARFKLKALTAREANAWPLFDMVDFTHAKDAQCKIDFPP